MEKQGKEIPRIPHHYKQTIFAGWRVVRPLLGWGFIILGVVGLVLPVLQGMLFLAIGFGLVGRRNPLLRWLRVHFKLLLRRMATLPYPPAAQVGRALLNVQRRGSRRLRHLSRWYQKQNPLCPNCPK
jgi:hypothetical protein